MKLPAAPAAIAIVPNVQTRLPADRNPPVVYLNSLAPGSRRAMLQALDKIATLLATGGSDACTGQKHGMSQQVATVSNFAWHLLRYQHAQALRTWLAELLAPASANKALSALKGVLQECWRLGLMASEDYHRAIDLKRVAGQRLKRGRMVQPQELKALFIQVAGGKNTARAMRDAAILAALFGAGLRRSEVVSLDRADFTVEIDDVTGGRVGVLAVRHAKHNKQRVVYFSNGALLALDQWLSVRGNEPGPLFCRINKNGSLTNGGTLRRLSDQAIYAILGELAQAASVRRFSPHDCRKTFISTLLMNGVDVFTVKALAGHESTATTEGYDLRGEEEKRQACTTLQIPYRRPAAQNGAAEAGAQIKK